MQRLSGNDFGAPRSGLEAHGCGVEPPVVAPSLPAIERLESHLPAVSAGGEAVPPGHDRYPGGRPRSARALLDPPAAPSRPERGSRGDRSRAALSHVADRPIPTSLTVALEHPDTWAHAGVRSPRPARAGGAHAAALRGGLRRGRGDAGPPAARPPAGSGRGGGDRPHVAARAGLHSTQSYERRGSDDERRVQADARWRRSAALARGRANAAGLVAGIAARA